MLFEPKLCYSARLLTFSSRNSPRLCSSLTVPTPFIPLAHTSDCCWVSTHYGLYSRSRNCRASPFLEKIKRRNYSQVASVSICYEEGNRVALLAWKPETGVRACENEQIWPREPRTGSNTAGPVGGCSTWLIQGWYDSVRACRCWSLIVDFECLVCWKKWTWVNCDRNPWTEPAPLT